MAFSKVKVGGLADDSVTAANIDDDGTGSMELQEHLLGQNL